jgi:hypothetical protein
VCVCEGGREGGREGASEGEREGEKGREGQNERECGREGKRRSASCMRAHRERGEGSKYTRSIWAAVHM